MAKLESYLRKELLKYIAGVKEDNRDPDTGILDTTGMVEDALTLWNQDDPDVCIEYRAQAAIYTGTTEFEKNAQSKRSKANRQLGAIGAALEEEDFEPGAVEAWEMPSPGELDLEYHVPIERNGMVAERLGDMTVAQVFSISNSNEQREISARKWKNYFRRVGYVALYWKKRKALGDEAKLWEIFGVKHAEEV